LPSDIVRGVPTLLTYWMNPRDTLVIASWHITWGFALGCVAFVRSFYIRKLFGQMTGPSQARCVCTRFKLGYVLVNDDSFDEGVDRSFEIYFD